MSCKNPTCTCACPTNCHLRMAIEIGTIRRAIDRLYEMLTLESVPASPKEAAFLEWSGKVLDRRVVSDLDRELSGTLKKIKRRKKKRTDLESVPNLPSTDELAPSLAETLAKMKGSK